MKFVTELFSLCLGVVVVWLTFREGGWGLVNAGITAGWKLTLKMIPIMLIALFVIGQAQVLMERYMDEIKVWLSGEKGIFVAFLGGVLTPSTIALFPIFKELWDQGVGRTAIVMFILSFTLLNWQILIFRVPLLGWSITLVSMAAAFVLALLAAGLFIIIERFWQ